MERYGKCGCFLISIARKKCILKLEPLDKGNKQKQIKTAKITPQFFDESDFFICHTDGCSVQNK